MAPAADDMADLDRPATLRDLRNLRAELRSEFRAELRSELQRFPTRLELRAELASLEARIEAKFATKGELEAGLASLRTEMATGFTEVATGFAEMRGYVDFSVKSVRDELRTHFDVIAEGLRADFRAMFDWMKASMASVTIRLDALESGHGERLTMLEMRVTRLETGRN